MRMSFRAALLTLAFAGAAVAAAPAAHAGPLEPPPPTLFVLVPNVLGDPLGEAKAKLIKSGLTVGSVTGVETCVSFGIVVTQDPFARTLAPKGSPVDLQVTVPPEKGCEG
jgi:beta-lactam-binding protein with PASTA domain